MDNAGKHLATQREVVEKRCKLEECKKPMVGIKIKDYCDVKCKSRAAYLRRKQGANDEKENGKSRLPV